MALAIKYIIVNACNGLYYHGQKDQLHNKYIDRIPKHLLFKTEDEAEKYLEKIPEFGYYQIDKIYKKS